MSCGSFFFFSCQQIAFQSLQFEGQYGKVYDLSIEALVSSHTLYFLKLLYQEWSGLQNVNGTCSPNGTMHKFVWKKRL